MGQNVMPSSSEFLENLDLPSIEKIRQIEVCSEQ